MPQSIQIDGNSVESVDSFDNDDDDDEQINFNVA